jgi:pilus assembly protein CpaC
MPGIASVPILGQLFRSKNVNHTVIELVVLVTATVVDRPAPSQADGLPKMVVPNLDTGSFDRHFPVHETVSPVLPPATDGPVKGQP